MNKKLRLVGAIFFTIFLIILGLIANVRLVKGEQKLAKEATASMVLFEDGFEKGLNNWHSNNSSYVYLAPGKGRGNTALAIKSPGGGGSSYAYRFFDNLTARVSVFLWDDTNLLRDPNDDTYVYISLHTNGSYGDLSIGIRPKTSTTNYTYCPGPPDGCMDTGIPRSAGWHQFKLFVTPKGSYGKIDATSLSWLPGNSINSAVCIDSTTFSRVTIGILGSTYQGQEFHFDDVSIDTWPGPSGSEAKKDLSQKFLNIYLNNYGQINEETVIDTINNYNKGFMRNCHEGEGDEGLECHERKIHIYMLLLHTAVAHGINYKLTGSTSSLNKAISIIEKVSANRSTAPWSDPLVTDNMAVASRARVDQLLTWASWLVRDKMSVASQQTIENFLVDEANYYSSQFRGYSFYEGNSSGEENSWPGEFLHWLYLAYNWRPEKETWLNMAKTYLFHSLTTGESYGGVYTQTLYSEVPEKSEKYLFDNHGFHPHSGYAMLPIEVLAVTDKLERKYFSGRIIPEFEHNVKEVWLKNRSPYINFTTFQYDKISALGLYNTNAIRHLHVRLNFYHLMNDLYPATNNVGPTGDLATHAFEYIYFIKDSYLGIPVENNVQFTQPEINEIDTANSKASIWLSNSIHALDYCNYLFLYVLNQPIGLLDDSRSGFEGSESFDSWKPSGNASQTDTRSDYRAQAGDYSLRVDYTASSTTPYYSAYTVLSSAPSSGQQIEFSGKYFVALREPANTTLNACVQHFSTWPSGWLKEDCTSLDASLSKNPDGSDGAWRDFKVVSPYIAGATQIVLKFDVAGSPGRVVYHVDSLRLEFVPAPTPTPIPLKHIKVLSLNGGEQLSQNNSYEIKWETSGVEKIGLVLYKNKTAVGAIARDIPTSYTEILWTPGPDISSGGEYRIGIYQYPWATGNLVDYNDNPFIIGP